MNKAAPLFKFEDEFHEPRHRNLALKLKVKETGSLLLDPNVTHPFVRVHIIDTLTCKYLAKSKPDLPGVYNREACFLMDKKGNFDVKTVDYLMPFSTKFFDMRIKGHT
jgi:hypothetical protein